MDLLWVLCGSSGGIPGPGAVGQFFLGGTRTARTVLRASGPVSFEGPAVGGEGVQDAFELAHA